MGFFGNLFLKKDEVVNERSVYKDSNISIGMFGSVDRNYGDQAYFKFVDNSDYSKAKKVARINFSDATYESHKEKGKINWEIKGKEKDKLIEVLNSKPNIGEYKNNPNCPTVWDALKMEFEKTTGQKLDITDMPDYTKL